MAQVEEKRVIGRYVLHGEIASGGMATVYFGRLMGEAGFSRVVAIKRLHPQYVRDADFRAMFLDEARVCARVRHPNVVSILDVVELEGELVLVMEYVQGETLSRLMRAARTMQEGIPVQMVVSIVSGVLDGLHAAHEALGERGDPLGIVHRDVSPQNIIVGVDGVARVVDFGVAKATGRLQTTRDGQLKGKLSYMAPEQLAGGVVDRRTDVYAASVVLWEALAGRRLFDGEQEAVVFGKVLQAEILPPSQHAPGIEAALDAVVMRGLARDPEQRFATALDMAVALEAAAQLAPARQVGQRVMQLAQAALHRRAEKFVEIESVSSVSLGPAHAASVPPGTASGVSGLSDPAKRSAVTTLEPRSVSQLTNLSMAGQGRSSQVPRSRVGLVAVLAAAATVGALLAVAVFALPSRRTAAPADGTSASPARTTEPIVPSIQPVPAEPPAVSASSPREPTAPSAPAVTRAPRPPASAKRASPPPEPKGPDCNPPYTLDAKGTRIPKLQCL